MTHWRPMGAIRSRTVPEPGTLIAWRHHVWRVISLAERDRNDWTDDDHNRFVQIERRPAVLHLRPVDTDTFDAGEATDKDTHLLGCLWRTPRGHDRVEPELWVYPDEHYPVCAHCAEPMPCRDQLQRKYAEHVMQRMEHHNTEGVCPYCQKPVTARENSITWDDNLVVPAGPPVTFHLRRYCLEAAIAYEESWLAADPDHRTPRLPHHRDETARFDTAPSDWTV